MAKQSIGIDCRLGGIAHAGIGRYIAELVKRVTKSTHDIRWVLFCSDSDQATELLGKNYSNEIEVIFAPIRQYSIKEQLELPRIFEAAKLDLLHVPHFNIPLSYSGKIVVTIHDLLWHEYKGMQVTTLNPISYWPKYWAYRFIARKAVERASTIFVPTQTVKKTIATYYPKSVSKILVTKEGIGSPLLEFTTKSSTKRKPNTLLYVGSLYPHKNVSLVLQALEELPEYTLEIVGARTAFLERLEAEVLQRNVKSQVVFKGRLSDAELAQSYKQTTALVQPSMSEGFGLTGLEALAFSTPVLASDIPIFHEVYQDAALYFDYTSVESLLLAIKKVAQTSIQKELALTAETVIKQYSWEKLATQTIAGYIRALQKN
jgi:glycosyltransferase involved in cell wall biosynthesis